MRNYLSEARAIAPELTGLRERLHRCPEAGNRELQTALFIEDALRSCGIETQRLLDTAVVGTLRGGKPGLCAALRADMDALPVCEQTGAAFASEKPGMMHACGHDVHMAATLGAARLLSAHRNELCGTVKFFFQPDEEGEGGASRMIAAGAMEGVDAVFGAHVVPELPLGTVGIRYGKFYAASDAFDLSIHGVSAHGATPEKGIDALAAAAELVCRFKDIPARFPGERLVVTVGTLRSGSARNILAGEAELSGIIRTLGPDTRAQVKALLRREVAAVAEKYGVRPELKITESYPGIVNSGDMSALAESAARALLGDGSVCIIDEPVMTTEDFGEFITAAKGCFYHIGAGCPHPLHSPLFLPVPEAVVTAAAVHAAVVESFLTGN